MNLKTLRLCSTRFDYSGRRLPHTPGQGASYGLWAPRQVSLSAMGVASGSMQGSLCSQYHVSAQIGGAQVLVLVVDSGSRA